MKIFLAGGTGVIGRRLIPLLRADGHAVAATTRRSERVGELRALGAEPVVIDVFDTAGLMTAMKAANPDAVIHQLTDLTDPPGSAGYPAALSRNARLRVEGTRNLVDAAKASGVERFIAQSIAFVYASGADARLESDPLDFSATGDRKSTVDGVAALEQAVLSLRGGVVLRYGFLYGPGTWFASERRAAPALHVDAAAHAALLALTRAEPGIYNIGEDDGAISSEKAKRELGFDAGFRIKS